MVQTNVIRAQLPTSLNLPETEGHYRRTACRHLLSSVCFTHLSADCSFAAYYFVDTSFEGCKLAAQREMHGVQ